MVGNTVNMFSSVRRPTLFVPVWRTAYCTYSGPKKQLLMRNQCIRMYELRFMCTNDCGEIHKLLYSFSVLNSFLRK